jgi:hypothetical protein
MMAQTSSPRRGRPPKNPNSIASSSKHPANSRYPSSQPKKRSKHKKLTNGHSHGHGSRKGKASSVETIYVKPPPDDYCSFCEGPNIVNQAKVHEKMVSCFQCGQSGHPSCCQMDGKLAQRVFTYDWICLNCKVCEVCVVKGKDVSLDRA